MSVAFVLIVRYALPLAMLCCAVLTILVYDSMVVGYDLMVIGFDSIVVGFDLMGFLLQLKDIGSRLRHNAVRVRVLLPHPGCGG